MSSAERYRKVGKTMNKLLRQILVMSITIMTIFVLMPQPAFAAPAQIFTQLDFVSDITSSTDNLATEGWAWDASTKTLTLDGLDQTYIDSSGAAIILPGDSTISIGAAGAVINSSGYICSGIRVNGNVTINGTGSISIVAAYIGIDTSGDFTFASGSLEIHTDGHGISCANNVTIQGGTVAIAAGTEGIYAGNAVIIEGGSGTVATSNLSGEVSSITAYYNLDVDDGVILVTGWDGSDYTRESAVGSFFAAAHAYATFVDALSPDELLVNIWFGPKAMFTAQNAVNLSSPTNLVFAASPAPPSPLAFDSIAFKNLTTYSGWGASLGAAQGVTFNGSDLTIPAALFTQHASPNPLTPGLYRARITFYDGTSYVDYFATFNLTADGLAPDGSIPATGDSNVLPGLAAFVLALTGAGLIIGVWRRRQPHLTI